MRLGIPYIQKNLIRIETVILLHFAKFGIPIRAFFLKKTNYAELDDNDEIDLTCPESCTEVLNQREKELSVEASFQEMWHADNF